MTEDDSISPISASPTCVGSFSRSSTTNTSEWTSIPLFEKRNQLCNDLEYTPESKTSSLRNNGSTQTLPDAPRVALNSSRVVSYCLEDLDTPSMNQLGQKMWNTCPGPEIKSLSQQLVLDFTIRVTEDPSMHLVWSEEIMYLKPIPAYLASYAFWEFLADPSNNCINPEERETLRTTSLGYLRTYARLIQRRSDFNIACRNGLLASFDNVSFEVFVAFISSFDSVLDKSISSRWRFGTIQLESLNFHSVLNLRRRHLNRFESRYGAYFQRYFPAVAFMFALLSVALSAMQVILAADESDYEEDGKRGTSEKGVFLWFAWESIGWSVAFGVMFIIWWISISSAEAWRRRKMTNRVKKRQKEETALSA